MHPLPVSPSLSLVLTDEEEEEEKEVEKPTPTKPVKPARTTAPVPALQLYGSQLSPGRVLLCVPEGWNGNMVVDHFRGQFAALPAPIELVPAMGADNAVMLCQQAMMMGGLDCVLMHPQFLQDRSQVEREEDMRGTRGSILPLLI